MFAAAIRKRRLRIRSFSLWRWHLDEAFVKINGETRYLWRAVDHEGEALEVFCDETSRPQGCTSISEEGHEALWPAEDDRDRSPRFISVSHVVDRKCVIPGAPAMAQQSCGEFTSTVSTARASDGEILELANLAQVRRRSRLNPQTLQSATPPDDARRLQAESRSRHGGMASAGGLRCGAGDS